MTKQSKACNRFSKIFIRTFLSCFEVLFWAVISVFYVFKRIYISQLSAESNFLLMIKFKLSEVLEVIIGISKGPYLSGSKPKFFKPLTCLSIVSKSFLTPLTSLKSDIFSSFRSLLMCEWIINCLSSYLSLKLLLRFDLRRGLLNNYFFECQTKCDFYLWHIQTNL